VLEAGLDNAQHGDNTEANFDYLNQGVCGARSDRRALWYEIVGTGKMATVSVCTNNDMVTDFGVFHECNNQDCAGAPQQQTESKNCDKNETVVLELMLDKDENYFIHVRADWIVGEGGTNFTVWYTEEGSDESTDDVADSAAMLSSFVALCASAFAVAFM
jgi:hypothetical protein